jgi:hypothetical protein
MNNKKIAAAAPGMGAAAATLTAEFSLINQVVTGQISRCDGMDILTEERAAAGWSSRMHYAEHITGQYGPQAVRVMMKDAALRAAGVQVQPGEIAKFMLYCVKLKKAIRAGRFTAADYRAGFISYVNASFIDSRTHVFFSIPGRTQTYIFDRDLVETCPISGFEFDPAQSGFNCHYLTPYGTMEYGPLFDALKYSPELFPTNCRPVWVDDLDEYMVPDCADLLRVCFCQDRRVWVSFDSAFQHSNGLWYEYPDGMVCSPEAAIGRYHGGDKCPPAIRFSRNSKYLVGFEVEKEDLQVKCKLTHSDFEYSLPGFRKERDGSLDDRTGFEFITPPMELSPRRIEDFFNSRPVALDHINANFTTKCGGHIHISCPGKTGRELFESMSGYIHLIHALFPKRAESNSYCGARPAAELARGCGKYSSFNVMSDRVEIRVFGAVRGLENLVWRAGLLKKITENPCFNSGDFYLNQLPKLMCHLKKVYTDSAALEKLIIRVERFINKYEGLKFSVADIDRDHMVKIYRPASYREILKARKGAPAPARAAVIHPAAF